MFRLDRDEVEHGMVWEEKGRERASVCIQVQCLVTNLLWSVHCLFSIWLKVRNLRIEDLPDNIQIRQYASFNTRY